MIIIGGPTAVGKSRVACLLADKLGGEIISADSMCVYRGMDIGTDKPRECMKRIKHHLIDILDPGEYFDAKLFEELATRSIRDIKVRGKVPIVAGGSYLYIQALIYHMDDTPQPDWDLRRKLYSIAEKRGREFLFKKLQVIDPTYAKKIHRNDLKRIVRALEVFLLTGKPFSSFHTWSRPRREFVGFFLIRSWESLCERIERRVGNMIEEGLVEEVKELVERGFENFITSSQAIGYKELVPYVKGERSLDECVKDIIKNTKTYAKRQIRWFRKQEWVEVNLDSLSYDEAVELIQSQWIGSSFMFTSS